MVEKTLLAEHTSSKGVKIKIYAVYLGTTANDNLQVRVEEKENPLWITEDYEYLKSSQLINDSTLQLVLFNVFIQDTSKLDTVAVSLK